MALIAIVLCAIKDVVDIAFVTTGHGGQSATEDALDNFAVHRAGNAIFVALIVGAFDIAARLRGWVGRDDADHARRCVLSKQRALWAAQHFDVVQINNIGDHLTRTGQNHAVDDGRDGRLSARRGGDGAKTTDQQRGVLIRWRGSGLDTGDYGHQIDDIVTVFLTNQSAADDANRDGRGLQGLVTQTGGHDHLFDLIIGLCSGFCCRGLGHGRASKA